MPNLPTPTTPYYGGGQVPNPADVIEVSGTPSTKLTDLGLGSLAVDNATGTIWGLVSKSGNSALWAVLGGGSSALATLTGNTGGPVSPIGGNINILGTGAIAFAGTAATLTATITPGTALLSTLTGDTGGAISPVSGNINIHGGTVGSFAGSGNTLTLTAPSGRFPITPFVVGAVGKADYQTIQSALTAAGGAGGGVVWVQPGTYNENLTIPADVQICGANPSGIIVLGTHSLPTSGTVSLSGIIFGNVGSGNIFTTSGPSSCRMIVQNCILDTSDGYAFDIHDWIVPASLTCYNLNANGTEDGFVDSTAGATVIISNSDIGTGDTHTMVLGGFTQFSEVISIGCPVHLVTGAALSSFGSNYQGPVTLSNNSTATFSTDTFDTGSSASITQSSTGAVRITDASVNSSHNPAIDGTGAGTLTLSEITLVNNANIAGTLTVSFNAADLFGEVRAHGDVGGQTGANSLTSTNSTTIGAGTGTVKMSSGNSANSAAWLKVYVGTTAYWIPAWTTNAP